MRIFQIFKQIWLFLSSFVQVRWLRQFADRQELLYYQKLQLNKHKKKWWPLSPFYRNYLSCPDQVPLMNKRSMMANFDQLNTHGILKEEALALAKQAEQSRDFSETLSGLTVGLSSGTSGIPGIFLVSKAEQAHWAGTILAMLLPRPFYRRQRIAFFLRANSNLYEQLELPGWIAFKFFDLARPLSETLDQLQSFAPTIIVAPAQSLEELVRQQQNGALSICPKHIFAVAEVMPDDVRKLIEDIWQQKVMDIYQATEGFLAATCHHGRLHLNESNIQFELDFLDQEHTRFCPIITDFRRTSQLMIRYRMDDILHLAQDQNCSCGQQTLIIDKIEGRCDDVLILPSLLSPNETIRVYPDYLSRTLLLIPEVTDFRIIQRSLTQLCVQWLGLAEQDMIQSAIENTLTRCHVNLKKMDLAYEPLVHIEVDHMHKRRRIRGLHRQLHN